MLTDDVSILVLDFLYCPWLCH